MNKNISPTNQLKMYHHQLIGFSKILDGANYVVSLGLHAFVLHNIENDFSIDLLKEMYIEEPEANLDGTIKPISFQSIRAEINQYFDIFDNFYNNTHIKSNTARAIVFWDIIERALGSTTPDKSWRYLDSHNTSLFSQASDIWDFSFILVKGRVGFVLLGGAGD